MSRSEYTPPVPLTQEVIEEEVTICTHCEQEIEREEAEERRIYVCSRCGQQVVPEEG